MFKSIIMSAVLALGVTAQATTFKEPNTVSVQPDGSRIKPVYLFKAGQPNVLEIIRTDRTPEKVEIPFTFNDGTTTTIQKPNTGWEGLDNYFSESRTTVNVYEGKVKLNFENAPRLGRNDSQVLTVQFKKGRNLKTLGFDPALKVSTVEVKTTVNGESTLNAEEVEITRGNTITVIGQ